MTEEEFEIKASYSIQEFVMKQRAFSLGLPDINKLANFMNFVPKLKYLYY
jgi:hypothetical protein